MQTHVPAMRPALRARAVSGRHVRGPKTVQRIIITAFMLAAAAVGTVAASGYNAPSSHPAVHHAPSAVLMVRNPWIY
jgi:hypothetical protein